MQIRKQELCLELLNAKCYPWLRSSVHGYLGGSCKLNHYTFSITLSFDLEGFWAWSYLNLKVVLLLKWKKH